MDFLRGVAAIYVLINHTRGTFFAGGSVVLAAGTVTIWDKLAIGSLQATIFGAEFVVLFFVLSGFAMAHSIRYSSGLSGFYLKRGVRVWLPYLGAAAFAATVCWAITAIIPTYRPVSDCRDTLCNLSGFAKVAFYISPSTPLTQQFWSLPYEIIFYILAPFILSTNRRIVVGLVVAAAGTVISLILYGVTFNPVESVAANFLLQELLFFEVGAIAYRYFHLVPTICGWRLLALLAFSGAAVAGLKLTIGSSNIPGNLIMVLATTVTIKGLPQGLGQSRWNLGFMSYSLYIFHVAALFGLGALVYKFTGYTQRDMTSYVAWVAVLPIILGVCWVMWYIVERPTTPWLEFLRRRPG